jgi:hopene-associated glycosyltransferase HpnB
VPDALLWSLAAAAGLALLAWLGVLAHPAKPWDMRPHDEEDPVPEPAAWPSLAVLIPARNEADSLPSTLPALVAQDYPGPWRIVLVDDRSGDGTAAKARELGGGRVEVVEGAELPEGWVGKMWALQQGLGRVTEELVLLTDADIRHEPGSLRALVAESELRGLTLTSRMARLRCESAAERLLIPAFVWFFNLLYPMRRVNEATSSCAAAAGGCVLVRRSALLRAGGFEAIRDRLIDDVSLAQRVKRPGAPIRLSLSRSRVRSLREYGSLGSIASMVRRTAFTQLSRSWLALAGTLLGLALLFVAPPTAVACGLGYVPLDPRALGVAALGGMAWATMAFVYAPAPRFFGLSGLRALLLPLVGLLYAVMTLDSAFRGPRPRWR